MTDLERRNEIVERINQIEDPEMLEPLRRLLYARISELALKKTMELKGTRVIVCLEGKDHYATVIRFVRWNYKYEVILDNGDSIQVTKKNIKLVNKDAIDKRESKP